MQDMLSEAVMGKFAFGSWDERLESASDEAFLSSIKWRKEPKGEVVKTAKLVSAMRKKLPSKSADRLLLLKTLLWSEGMISDAEHGPLYQIVVDWARSLEVHQSSRKGRGRARGSMGKDDAHIEKIKGALEKELPVSGLQPQEILAGLVLTIVLADELPGALFLKLWRFCLSSGLQLSTMLDEPMGEDVPADVEMLFQAEIPWLLGHLFEDVKGSGNLLKRAKSTIGKALDEGTDTDGTPHAALLSRLPFWLGSLNRILILSRLFDVKALDAGQKTRLGSLLRHAISMSRGDGQIVLSQVNQTTWLSILCQTADELDWDASHASLVLLHDMARANKTAVKGPRSPREAKRNHALSPTKGTLPSTQTDWGKMAHLRTAWSQRADLFSISYEASTPRIEFSPRGKLAFRGDWETTVLVDGKAIPLSDEWSCSCWYADEEVDYLELQMSVEGETSLSLNRMIFLSRDQQILIVGDALHLNEVADVEITSTWSSEVDFKPVSDQLTRRFRLDDGNLQLHVLPTFVPMEKIEKAFGTVSFQKRKLSWGMKRTGSSMFMPLILDWNPSRRDKEPVWKSVTVAEDGKRLTDDIATAKLAGLGKKQILLYHSLRSGRFGRSILGHHTHHETVIGEFIKDGTLRPLVHIETPEEE